jgi:hypothetical protein
MVHGTGKRMVLIIADDIKDLIWTERREILFHDTTYNLLNHSFSGFHLTLPSSLLG